MDIAELPAHQVQLLVHDIETKGFACIPNYFPPADLQRMQQFVNGTIAQKEKEYVHFNGPDAVRGSGLEELGRSRPFVRLMHDLYRCSTGNTPIEEEFYQVLRCLAGKSGRKNSLIFHYDSYVVTALVPILIPKDGRTGDLLMYPNTRRIRNAYLFNAIDKILIDNPATQRVLRACIDKKRFSPVRIKMMPGNIYLFWGYRSIHANEACDVDKVRATALFHYANPHRKRGCIENEKGSLIVSQHMIRP
jgi:hypothetical protein